MSLVKDTKAYAAGKKHRSSKFHGGPLLFLRRYSGRGNLKRYEALEMHQLMHDPLSGLEP
ncbi:MAG TPA: hypothetical protein VFK06_00895 [Candidatus Angelobacter sp.]|nr:hypothetical protein [Candidatus Angelobacter sp.]